VDKERMIEALRGYREIVINSCYGGFGLSDRALIEYKKMAGISQDDFFDRDISRDDPYLIKIVRSLGMAANGSHANLKIVEIPADIDWLVQEHDGLEWVAEKHRTWS